MSLTVQVGFGVAQQRLVHVLGNPGLFTQHLHIETPDFYKSIDCSKHGAIPSDKCFDSE